ncbi:MAG: NlpC/P60 family protein [Leptospira sp.]|nr:NlpC/P60 family protein [Leptospira sp.]
MIQNVLKISFALFLFPIPVFTQNLDTLNDLTYSKQESLLIRNEVRKSLGDKANSKEVREIVQNLKPWAMMEGLPPLEFAKSVKRFYELREYGIQFEDVEELIPYFYSKIVNEEDIVFLSRYFKEANTVHLPDDLFYQSLLWMESKKYAGPSILLIGRMVLLGHRFGVGFEAMSKSFLKYIPKKGNQLNASKVEEIFDTICADQKIPLSDKNTKVMRSDLTLFWNHKNEKREFIKSERRIQVTLNDLGEWEMGERPKLDPSILSEVVVSVDSQKDLSSNLISVSKSWVGVPYRYGAMSRTGIDCSGLTTNILIDPKIAYPRNKIPRSARDQATMGTKVDQKSIRIGDLVFFSASPNQTKITHVGLSLLDRQFIHASTSRGVVIQSLDEKWWKDRFVIAKKIFERK